MNSKTKNDRRIARRIATLIDAPRQINASGIKELILAEVQSSAKEFAIHRNSHDAGPMHILGALELVTDAVVGIGYWLIDAVAIDDARGGEPDDYRRGYRAAIDDVRREFAPQSRRDHRREDRARQKQLDRERAAVRAQWVKLTPEEQAERWHTLFADGGLRALYRHARAVGYEGDVRSLVPKEAQR